MPTKRELQITREFMDYATGRITAEELQYIGKSPRKAVQHEAQIQTALFEWAKLNEYKYPELALMYHIPNGGRRDAVSGYRLKQQGVKSGVPDICLPVPKGNYYGLYLELKSENGRVQPNQKEWIAKLERQGYKAVVCFGLDESITQITNYLTV